MASPPDSLVHPYPGKGGQIMPDREKVVGIIGGMGPEATVDLMQRIIRLVPARDDQDHIRCLVDCNSKIPSRIKAIAEGTGEDPCPRIIEAASGLEAQGADFLAIACNTAHHYYDRVQSTVNIPVIHLMEIVTAHIIEHFPGISRIGMLASPATKITGIYTRPFADRGLVEIWPQEVSQTRLLEVIQAVKAGDTGPDVRKTYQNIFNQLEDLGAGITLVACTELGLLPPGRGIPTLDAAQILAERIAHLSHNPCFKGF